MNPREQAAFTAGIEAAADALLRVIVRHDRERFAAFKGRPFMGPGQPGATDALDVADLISTACKAELRRIDHAHSDPRSRSGPGRRARDRHHDGVGRAAAAAGRSVR